MSLKFVNLHGHDGHSIYDAIGSPEDYAEWMLKNAGEDSGALAITNHGNMNSIGAMVAAQKKYNKKGAPVKFLYGVEAYYIPSLENWREIKEQRDLEKKEKKSRKKDTSGDTDLVIENEKESKSKYFDPINRRNHLVLVARDQQGLQNLFRLVTRSYRQGFYRKPRIDLEMLKEFNEGIIASTACLAGVPSWCSLQNDDDVEAALKMYDKELLPLMEVFGKERFFLELQFNRIPEQQIVNKHLIEYSKRSGYDLIATADCHYPDPQTFKDREIYRLLGYQMQKANIDLSILEKDISEIDAELYLKSGDQMFQAGLESFPDFEKHRELIKEAIQRTHSIAHDYVGNVFPDESIKLPKTFQITQKVKTPFDRLKELCIEALRTKKLDQKQEYIDRAIYELKVIKKLGVEEYFLALKKMLDVIREEMLTGVGRGSGVGSLVCYLLDITFLDPIKHGLLFERFLSPSRAEMPDIDSDTENKERAFEIIRDHFGEDNVIAISNYNRLQLKSLIKDISRLYDVPFNEVNACTKVIEKEARDPIMAEIGHDQKLYELTFEKAMKHSKTLQEFIGKYPKVGERIENLYREVKSIGRHAGGLIFVPNAEDCLPVIRIRGVDQSPITEGITAQHLKHFGLIKFDMLALATLRIIRRCIEIILREQGVKRPTISDVWNFYNENLHPDVIDYADEKVSKRVYCAGNFPSIFQFEKARVQAFCVKAQPESATDISAVTALWRPGPLKGKADKRYLFYDEKKFAQEHPIIREVLGETRGLLVYQEQFMMLAHRLAGFSLEEADKLRKLLVKPSHELGEEMMRQRIEVGKKFVQGCIDKGLSPERAETLWKKEILGFISYGFNKSHSQAYAFNSYQCAWLYTYYEKEWIKACLEMDPELEKTINTTRALGYPFNKVDVNYAPVSRWSYMDAWNPPLTSLKGIGVSAANELVDARPDAGFRDIHHFLYDEEGKWRWSKLNKKVMEVLMKAEAFSSLNCVGTVFANYRHMHDFILENWDKLKKGKVKLEEAALCECEDWSTAEKILIQRQICGYFDKGLIVGKFLKTFEEFDITAIDEYGEFNEEDEEIPGDKVKVWAIVEKAEERQTRHGKSYMVITVSGTTDRPYVFKIWNMGAKQNTVWHEGNVLVFSLDYDEDYGYSLSRGTKVLRITK